MFAPESPASLETTRVRVAPAALEQPGVAAELAGCLSAAFSTDVWARTPIPFGPASHPHSALGVIHELGRDAVAVAAYRYRSAAAEPGSAGMIGFVLGTAVDAPIIDAYGLAEFGAEPGDALLAYIGIVDGARGLRVRAVSGSGHGVVPVSFGQRGTSLARYLIESWASMPALDRCPQLFIRTRAEIPAVVHLCESMGFEPQGSIVTEFLGAPQERLVYRREHAKPPRRER